MESNNRTQGRDQQTDHRKEMKSRYSEPENDSPYQFSQEAINEQSKYSRYQKAADQHTRDIKTDRRFPESGANRDHRGLPGVPDLRTPSNDARIREIITDRLADDPSIDARDINVIVRQGDVRLIGTVDNAESKQRAESFVSRIPGIKHAESELRIRPGTEEPDRG